MTALLDSELFHSGSVTDSEEIIKSISHSDLFFSFAANYRYGVADMPLNVALVVIHIEFLHLNLSFKPKQNVSDVICTTPISGWSQLHSEWVSNAIPFFLRPVQSA